MAGLPELADRLRALLEESRRSAADRREDRALEMAELDRRERRYSEVARRLMQEAIEPRLETLVSVFPHAGPVEHSRGGQTARLTFRSTPHFPIGADLAVSVDHDRDFRELTVAWNVEILPILVDYEREARFRGTIEEFDWGGLGPFLEERTIKFTRDYLRVHEPGSPYMQGAFVVDPVCGMKFSPTEAACTLQHEGETYYFCAESCREQYRERLGIGG